MRSFIANGKVNAAVLANLLQHVVKETKPGGNIAPTTVVQIEADKDIRLFRRAAHLGNTFSGKHIFCHISYIKSEHANDPVKE
jgi:hypothetical protein